MKYKKTLIFGLGIFLLLVGNGCGNDSLESNMDNSSTMIEQDLDLEPTGLSIDRSALIESVRQMEANDAADYAVYFSYPQEQDIPIIADDQKMRSASMIKVFILADAMEMVKTGILSLDDSIVLKHTDKVGGAGVLVGYPNGSKLSIREILELMITESDNTATNLMIDCLGMENINQYIQSNGYYESKLQRKMMDVKAVRAGYENYTSARDVGTFFLRLYHGQCVSPEYDGVMKDILLCQTDKECFPSALPSANIAHKTGELDGLYSDGGIIYTSDCQDSICVILTDHSNNRGKTLQNMRSLVKYIVQEGHR